MWFVLLLLACVPLGLTLWALTDAARHPAWVWAFAERAQVNWIAAICFGALVLPLGLAVCGYYLLRVRPVLDAIEGGQI